MKSLRLRHFFPAIFVLLQATALFFCFATPCAAGLFDIDEVKEARIGEEVAQAIIAQYGLVREQAERDRLLAVGATLIRAGGRPELEYHFYIINTDMVNAFALPGGYVFTTRGLMDFIDNDDELAAVLGHELAHVARRHSVTMYKKSMKTMLANFLILLLTRDPSLVIANEMYQQGRTEMFGRRAEIEADTFGTEYCINSGYDPASLINFLEKMARLEQHRPPLFEGYFDVHPPTEDRIRIVKNHLAKLNVMVTPATGNPVRARVFAAEDCRTAAACEGVIRNGALELMRLADPGKNRSAYDRARETALMLNSLLEDGVEIYDVKIRDSSEGPGLWIKDTLLVHALPGDAASAALDAHALASDWEHKLKNFIWSEHVRDE